MYTPRSLQIERKRHYSKTSLCRTYVYVPAFKNRFQISNATSTVYLAVVRGTKEEGGWSYEGGGWRRRRRKEEKEEEGGGMRRKKKEEEGG